MLVCAASIILDTHSSYPWVFAFVCQSDAPIPLSTDGRESQLFCMHFSSSRIMSDETRAKTQPQASKKYNLMSLLSLLRLTLLRGKLLTLMLLCVCHCDAWGLSHPGWVLVPSSRQSLFPLLNLASLLSASLSPLLDRRVHLESFIKLLVILFSWTTVRPFNLP